MGRPVNEFLKVFSKTRNFRILTLTLEWKRMPPF